MRTFVGIAVLLMVVAVMATPAVAQSPATAVSSDGSMILAESAAPGSGTPVKGNGNYALTGAEKVSQAEALAASEFRPLVPRGSLPEAIVGDWDTRNRVVPYNYYPARATAYLTGYQSGLGNYSCTAVMIGPYTAVTTGHCVHSGGPGGVWSTNVKVYPAYNGRTSGGWVCSSRQLWSVTGWTNSSNINYDYGAIILNCTVGNSTGWFGFYHPSTVNNLPAIIQGYPGDLAGRYPWIATDRVFSSTSTFLKYRTDTGAGESGSAVWWDNNGPYIYGIHGYAFTGYNGGIRVNTSVYNNFVYWKYILD